MARITPGCADGFLGWAIGFGAAVARIIANCAAVRELFAKKTIFPNREYCFFRTGPALQKQTKNFIHSSGGLQDKMSGKNTIHERISAKVKPLDGQRERLDRAKYNASRAAGYEEYGGRGFRPHNFDQYFTASEALGRGAPILSPTKRSKNLVLTPAEREAGKKTGKVGRLGLGGS